MARLRQALNVLTGRSLDRNGPPVYLHPDSWRCSRCGGEMFGGPPGKPFFHNCVPSRVNVAGPRIRYVGLRRHVARVWVSVWENRPRVESGPPGHARTFNPGGIAPPSKWNWEEL